MIQRIYHHHERWEDTPMYKPISPDQHDDMLNRAVKFMSDHKLFGKYMVKVLSSWPISCEHNLSNQSINRRAWIGQAACYVAIKCPEEITRKAWHLLIELQQKRANLEADKTIIMWESYAKKILARQCVFSF